MIISGNYGNGICKGVYHFLLQQWPDAPSLLWQFSLEFPTLVWNGFWKDVEVMMESLQFRGRDDQLSLEDPVFEGVVFFFFLLFVFGCFSQANKSLLPGKHDLKKSEELLLLTKVLKHEN